MSGPLRVIDMFAGIGGFSLGLHRAGGFETIATVEIDPFASRVLDRRVSAPNLGDVTTAEFPDADVICAGFPCQDISLAGKGAGLAGARSGLWREVVRAVRVVRPFYALLENVAALLGRGMGTVLGDLAEERYDAEWDCIPASAVGAPHRRDRIWLLAYPEQQQQRQDAVQDGCGLGVARPTAGERSEGSGEIARRGGVLAYAKSKRRREARQHQPKRFAERLASGGAAVSHANQVDAQGFFGQRNDTLIRREQIERQARLCGGAGEHQDWTVEPAVGRVAHGVPDRVGQLRAYGNAIVPQIAELIGRALLASIEAERLAA